MKKTALFLSLLMIISAFSGCASKGNYIGIDRAKEIALDNAGVSEADVVGLEVDLESDNLRSYYEVSFDSSGYDYEYEIEAISGDVLRQKRDLDDDARLPIPTASDETPHDGALATDAQAVVTTAPDTTTAPETEPAPATDAPATEPAPAETVAATNAPETKAPQTKAPETAAPATAPKASKSDYIGGEKARDIALDHAGYKSSEVYDLEYELDRERGVVVYDVSFDAGDYDYDYEIDAVTGEILRSDKQWDNDYKPDPSLNSAEYIGSDKAKDAALSHAGLSSSDVRELEVELDHRLTSVVYEVSFDSAGYEYDYVINAITGEVESSKKERD